MKHNTNRLKQSILSALPKAAKTIIWLLKIILPISLAVSFLQYWGIIAVLADFLKPLFALIGLPGESAIVFISSLFLSLYAPIAIMTTLALDMREITILALMCLISHNLFVESAVQQKTGTSAVIMFCLRIISSFAGAALLNYFLPEKIGSNLIQTTAPVFSNYTEMLIFWLQNSGWLIMKIVLIVCGLMCSPPLLKEYKIIDVISKFFAPFMKVMGLDPESSFLWFVSQIVGLTYGSAIMIESVDKHEIAPRSAMLLNYHIAINHSLLEDTLLFVAVGVPAGWIVGPRFLLALLVVWTVRFIMYLSNRKRIQSIIQP